MVFDIVILAVSVAGVGTIWKSLLRDVPALKSAVGRTLPAFLTESVLCGFCFTFWLSLAFVFVFDPLRGWTPAARIALPTPLLFPVHLFFSWMAMGSVAWFFRFLLDELQEFVHLKNHALKKETGHP